MTFDQFSYALIGGLLIGISASLLLFFNGRVAGISGIFWRTLAKFEVSSALFILGLPLGAWLFHMISQSSIPLSQSSLLNAVIGGLLVGIGVKLGNGCISGHGGLGQLSTRSLIATLVFMSAGIIMVALMRHIL